MFTAAFIGVAERLNIWPNCMFFDIINGNISGKMMFYIKGHNSLAHK